MGTDRQTETERQKRNKGNMKLIKHTTDRELENAHNHPPASLGWRHETHGRGTLFNSLSSIFFCFMTLATSARFMATNPRGPWINTKGLPSEAFLSGPPASVTEEWTNHNRYIYVTLLTLIQLSNHLQNIVCNNQLLK